MARPVILLLSGPNLNLLGDREPDIYGTETLLDLVAAARDRAQQKGFDLEHVQSNHEGDLIDAVHSARNRAAGVIINPGALTHYSWALHD
ncbi:MAG TPA: type II 3-dehydroquinate dehydratase, partial [Acidimicrobiales bacterium]|nr:type II 3-dehydroquinate dehydratase [Acidimicrobiales bacterium]